MIAIPKAVNNVTDRIRRGNARQHQVDESSHRDEQAEPFPRQRTFPTPKPNPNHRRLHRTEEDQRSRSRLQRHVRQREGNRVDEQGSARPPGPGTPLLCSRLGDERRQRNQDSDAAPEADGRESHRIDEVRRKRHSAQQRVRRERDEGHRSQKSVHLERSGGDTTSGADTRN